MKHIDRRLIFANGTVVELNLPVRAIARCGSVYVVTTVDPGKDTESRNLYAYDEDGELLWRAPDRSFPSAPVCPYIAVERVDDERVRVWDLNGVIYEMDARTGNVLSERFGK